MQQANTIVSYEKKCQDVYPSELLMLKDTVYTLKSIIVHMGSSVEE